MLDNLVYFIDYIISHIFYIYLIIIVIGILLIYKGIIDSFTAEHWDRGWFEVIIGMLLLIIFGKNINLL